MKASVKLFLAVLCIALIIGAASAKGNSPGNTGNGYPMFINLTEKDSSVVAPNGAWGWILDGGFGKLQYKTAPNAAFVFNAAKMTRYTKFALISYAEPYPGTGSTILGTAVSDISGAVSIKGKKDVTTGFVCNRYPTPTSNEYLVNGTKICLVPTSDLSMPLIPGIGPSFDTTYFTTWNDADYLFETDLVNKGCIAPEASCESGFGDCDGIIGNGCEINTDLDVNNCGGCNNVCNLLNAYSTCEDGTCTFDSCREEYASCDDDLTNGCEQEIYNDVEHCGDCYTTCDAEQICRKGDCTYPS